MANAGESDLASLWTYAIVDFEMAGLHPHADTEAMYGEHAAFANGRIAQCGRVLYVGRSCHGSCPSCGS